uniref:Cytochrome c-553 n=1 Tax=Osmundea sinicola TaxID=290685 RepID=A0A7L4WNH0_9FLOR|nr:cytochrome c553 [Osmundea sinicola]QFR99804.1 cytochrome c553 [Osmundea sinicola]
MKFILSLFSIFVVTLFIGLQLVSGQDEDVISIELGQRVFNDNCVACHLGGNNSVIGDKTLKLEALQENSKDSISAIVTQVTNGNGAMPPFGDKLQDNEIESVANYVLNQAKTNSW